MKTIKKIFNHNVVLVVDQLNSESVVSGLGIGFEKKVGEQVAEERIEKVFKLQKPSETQYLEELFQEIPEEYFEVTRKIVAQAEKNLGKKLDSHIFIHLTDHIYFAKKRMENQNVLHNNLEWEIKSFYQNEYAIAVEALLLINSELGLKLPESEASFIALHFVNALGEYQEMSQTIEQTRMIKDIINIIQYENHFEIDQKALDYARLVTHLRYFSMRISDKKQGESHKMGIYDQLISEFSEAYRCVEKIKVYMEVTHEYRLSYDDILYLTVHLNRLIESMKDKER